MTHRGVRVRTDGRTASCRSFYGRDACLLARASGFGKPFSEAVRKRSSSAFSNRGASARKSGSRRAVAQVALGARRWFVRPLPRASVTGFSFLLLGVGSLGSRALVE